MNPYSKQAFKETNAKHAPGSMGGEIHRTIVTLLSYKQKPQKEVSIGTKEEAAPGSRASRGYPTPFAAKNILNKDSKSMPEKETPGSKDSQGSRQHPKHLVWFHCEQRLQVFLYLLSVAFYLV